MVATGWVCSEHMTEERVHFSGERERVPRGRSIQERVKSALRERFQGGVRCQFCQTKKRDIRIIIIFVCLRQRFNNIVCLLDNNI